MKNGLKLSMAFCGIKLYALAKGNNEFREGSLA